MPNQPKTPARTVRVDDELWNAVRREAEAKGENVSDVVRQALRKYLGLALVVLTLSGCAAQASASPATAPVAAASAASPEWNGATTLTAADALAAVAATPVSDTPAKLEGAWGCSTPITVRPEAGPGVEIGEVYHQLDYSVGYLTALGYRVAVGAPAAYEPNAEAPAKVGTVTIVVTSQPQDQEQLGADKGNRAVTLTSEEGGRIGSAAIVVDAKRGLAGDILLHEFGHVLGLGHKDGTVMQAKGASPVVFDADETAAVTCH